MSRFYTIDEANALVPEVAQVTGRLRNQRIELITLRDTYVVRERDLDGPASDTGDVTPAEVDDPELRRLRLRMRGIVDQMQADVAWLDQRSIVLRDIGTGLLDFPALVEGRPVWLCWRLGEPHVESWHGHDDGYAGRRPLTALADEGARA